MVRFNLLLGFLLFTHFSYSQKIGSDYEHLMHPVRNYIVYQTISEINIDGKPDEISWQQAEWSQYFKDIEGDAKPEPLYQTRFKMLWDEQFLYILAELEEPHIWSYYATHDQIVFHENDFEIFIDPNRDTHNYFEFELNARNTLFDLFMSKPYRNGGRAEIDWNIKNFESAISINGTLNNPKDIDEKWIVELAIPFKSLTKNGKYVVPENGSFWKINFSRVQWKTVVVDGKYQKVKDIETNKYLSENNWVWSAQGVVNMHFPERWGLAQFSTNKVGRNTTNFYLPDEERLGKYLWYVYYKQQSYKREKGIYANSVSELDIAKQTKTDSGESILIEIKTNGNGFTATLQNEDGLKLSLNQNELFQILSK
jgi:hypothetical protein